MIKADKLEYRAITRALEQGHFYASWGPAIHITCSPASRITATTCSRNSRVRAGQGLTEASFPLRPEDDYIRITVTDSQGRCADTNAYFMEDILL